MKTHPSIQILSMAALSGALWITSAGAQILPDLSGPAGMLPNACPAADGLLSYKSVNDTTATADIPRQPTQSVPYAQRSSVEHATAPAPARADGSQRPHVEERWLVRNTLFDPLVADPKWAHFSASLHNYGRQKNEGDVGWAGAVSFGESLNFYEGPAFDTGRWGVGIQAGVFAIFDMQSESHDLINADYWVGIPVTYRDGPWQTMARIYHQSSHLGDEYLLRSQSNRDNRVNLSFEVVDLKVSRYFQGDMLRVYGGGGYIFHREPKDLKPWLTQTGAEYRSPYRMFNDTTRPIAALDVRMNEESEWEPDYSARAGLEFLGDGRSHYTVQLLLEYYNGRSPHGQFYDRKTDYWGLGLHAFF